MGCLEAKLLPLLTISLALLYPQPQLIKLFIDSYLVSINASLALHAFLKSAVCLIVFEVHIIHLEYALRKLFEEVDDEGAPRLVLIEKREDELLQVLSVCNLEGQRLLEKNLVHETFMRLILEWRLERGHLIHDYTETEDVCSMIVRHLLDNFG